MKVKSALLGVVVGDALGVPVEFKPRPTLNKKPVTDMVGYGTYNQPPGTWSDDSSMTVATAHSIANCKEINCKDIADKFVYWLYNNQYTAHGEVFDCGNTTMKSINQYIATGVPKGLKDKYSNGNGSLMRIMPATLYCCYKNLSVDETIKIINSVSEITHGHPISCTACDLYTLVAKHLIQGEDAAAAVLQAYTELSEFYGVSTVLYKNFSRIPNLISLQRSDISSSGYVVDTLEAALWCLITSTDYSETVLKAVNLGSDTDTVAAVAGGLAGLLYPVPEKWVNSLARKKFLLEIFGKFEEVLQ